MERRKTQKTRLSGLIAQAFKRKDLPEDGPISTPSHSRTSKLCSSEFIRDVVFGPRSSKVASSSLLSRQQRSIRESCKAPVADPYLSGSTNGFMPEIWYEGLYDRLDFEPCSSAWSPCSSVEATDSHLVPSPLFSTDSASAHFISRTPDLTIDSSTTTDDESFEGLISTSQSVEKVSENLAMSDPLEACLSRLQKAYYGVNAARRASDASEKVLEEVLDFGAPNPEDQDSGLRNLLSDLTLGGDVLAYDPPTCSSPCPSLPLPPLPCTPLPKDPDTDNLKLPAFGSLNSRLMHGSRHPPAPASGLTKSAACPNRNSFCENSANLQSGDYQHDMSQLINHSGNQCQARRRRKTNSPSLNCLDIDELLNIATSPLDLISEGAGLFSDPTYSQLKDLASVLKPSASSKREHALNFFCLRPQHILQRRSREGCRPVLDSGPAF